jgi:hypothetical protein
VIGEEQLLNELDVGLLQEPQPATEVAPSAGIAPTVRVVRVGEPAGISAVEPNAAVTGGAEDREFDEIGDEPQQRAPAGIDGEREPEPVSANVRPARTSHAWSRSRPRGLGAAATVGIAAVLATVVMIVLETGGSEPSLPDPRVGRQELEARALHAGLRRAGRGERGERAVPEPARGDGRAQAHQSSAPSATSTTADAATAPVPAPRAAAPEPSPAPRSTPAPAQNASPAVVQQEFGP